MRNRQVAKSLNITRVVMGLLLIIVPGLLTSWKIAAKSMEEYSAGGQNEVMAYEQRYAEMKKVLPVVGKIGYLTDLTDQPVSDAKKNADYCITQYVLAPVLLIRGTSPKLIIANMHQEPNFAENLSIVNDFRGGLFLLSHKNQ